MKIKNYLVLIFTFLITISFSVQAFAAENVALVNEPTIERLDSAPDDANFQQVLRIYFDDDSKNKSNQIVNSREINIPNYVETSISFTSSSDFVVKTLNIGITPLVDIRYTMRVYNTKDQLAYIKNNYDAGGLSPMKSVYDSFSYPAINIGYVEITVTVTNKNGSTSTQTGTAYR